MGEPSQQAGFSGRWVPLVGATILQLCAGSVYVTGLYSADLKERFFNGNQVPLEQLIFASNLGNWLPAAGFFNDSRFGGGRNTALVAALLTLLGYLGLWAWSAEVLNLQYWQAWIFWFLWGHGSGWFDNAAMTNTARNFPKQRGRSLGLVKAFYGLSGSVITQVYDLFFYERTSAFLLYLGIFQSAMGALTSLLLHRVPCSHHGELDRPSHRLGHGLLAVVGLAVALALTSIWRIPAGVTALGVNVTAFLLVLAFLGLMVWLLLGSRGRAVTAEEGSSPLNESLEHMQPLSSQACPVGISAREAICSVNFWLMFVMVFAGMGGGLVIINNIAQMVTAQDRGEAQTTLLVSLLSVANCLGRITFGVLPDALTGTLSIYSFFAANLFIMACVQVLLAVGTWPLLCLGAIIGGFSYGGFWTLMPATVIDLFGLESFATLYNVMALAVAFSSFLCSSTLAAKVYDHESGLHPDSEGGCKGPTCFRPTCLVMAALAGLGFISALMLGWRRPNASSCARQVPLHST